MLFSSLWEHGDTGFVAKQSLLIRHFFKILNKQLFPHFLFHMLNISLQFELCLCVCVCARARVCVCVCVCVLIGKIERGCIRILEGFLFKKLIPMIMYWSLYRR